MTKEVAIRNLEMIRIAFVNPATKEQRKLINDTVDMAISALSEIKGEPIECARTLKKHCINTKDCKECFMWDECKYELSAPCDWDLPDGEKGGE